MTDRLPVLVIGLFMFLAPVVMFAYSALTERGRRAYAGNIEESKRWPKMGGLIPMRPARGRIGRWAYSHPWLAAGSVAALEGVAAFLIHRTLLGNDSDAAARDALWFAAEGFVIVGLILREFWKQYGRGGRSEGADPTGSTGT